MRPVIPGFIFPRKPCLEPIAPILAFTLFVNVTKNVRNRRNHDQPTLLCATISIPLWHSMSNHLFTDDSDMERNFVTGDSALILVA